MITQTSTEKNIVTLNVKIQICEDQLKLLHKNQKETLFKISECGTYTHFQQLEMKLQSNQKLILLHENDLKKHRKELEKENGFLLHLQQKKQ